MAVAVTVTGGSPTYSENIMYIAPHHRIHHSSPDKFMACSTAINRNRIVNLEDIKREFGHKYDGAVLVNNSL
jgi:hypothetical protein